jgi:hypothetical protein
MSANSLEMLGGLTAGKSINEIKDGLEPINQEKGIKSLWKGNGFEDN